jgi:hypothetical protein
MNTYYAYSNIDGFIEESVNKNKLLELALRYEKKGHEIEIFENTATEDNLVYKTFSTLSRSKTMLRLNALKNLAIAGIMINE